MIKLKDIKVDVASTLGDRFLLTGITPKYVYAEGEKTDKADGTYYNVLCTDRGYMSVRVSVPGESKISANSGRVEIPYKSSCFSFSFLVSACVIISLSDLKEGRCG